MPAPNEADLECAYRVLKHCHPVDHQSAGLAVAQYRTHILRDFRARLIKAYEDGHVKELIDEMAVL